MNCNAAPEPKRRRKHRPRSECQARREHSPGGALKGRKRTSRPAPARAKSTCQSRSLSSRPTWSQQRSKDASPLAGSHATLRPARRNGPSNIARLPAPWSPTPSHVFPRKANLPAQRRRGKNRLLPVNTLCRDTNGDGNARQMRRNTRLSGNLRQCATAWWCTQSHDNPSQGLFLVTGNFAGNFRGPTQASEDKLSVDAQLIMVYAHIARIRNRDFLAGNREIVST